MHSQTKRTSDHLTPPSNEVQKRYTWDFDTLITQNRFYIPPHLEPADTAIPSTSETINKIKVPPIYLHEVKNHREIISDLDKLTEKQDYTTKYFNNSLKINVTCDKDYRNVTKFYTDHNIPFHTYQNPNDRPVSVIFRNVPISLTTEEITQDIEKYNLPVIKITRLTNREKQPIPLCAVELLNNDVTSDVYKIKDVCKALITVEPRRGNYNNPPQCHRCQRIGHTKNYCKLQPRCVKCRENHLYTQCPKNINTPPTCVNCGEQHPANYKGCEYIKNMRTKKNVRQPIIKEHNTLPSSQNNPSTFPKSYSEAVKNKINQSTTPNYQNNNNLNDPTNPWIDQLLNFLKNLITPFIDQLKSFFTSQILPGLFNIRT